MAIFLMVFLVVFEPGVVIVDNVWFYEGDLKTSVLNTGDIVGILERGDTYFRVSHDTAIGEIHKGVLIDIANEVALEKLFIFAQGYFEEGEYKKAAVLFDIFVRHFNESEYLAEVLYYQGLANEKLAKIYSQSDTIPGFVLHNHFKVWYYGGETYAIVLERFPESVYAPKAAFRLIALFRTKNEPWFDCVEPIQEELMMWQDFISKFGNSGEYIKALVEIGYLNRVLFEITKNINYKQDAIEVFQKIIESSQNSVYSAQAKVHLHEITVGEYIYKY